MRVARIKYYIARTSMMEASCWCMIDIDGQNVRARIVHKRRGKFRVEDDDGGRYRGRIIEASDITSCNVDRNP